METMLLLLMVVQVVLLLQQLQLIMGSLLLRQARLLFHALCLSDSGKRIAFRKINLCGGEVINTCICSNIKSTLKHIHLLKNAWKLS